MSLARAEVQDLHRAARRDHHVLGLQVPVDDSGVVRRREAVRDLRGDRQSASSGAVPRGEPREGFFPATSSIAMKGTESFGPTS